MSTERDPQRRESPVGHILKSDGSEAIAQSTSKQRTAEGAPGQGTPRQNDVRIQHFNLRSHKSYCRLTDSRTDSREQMYRFLNAAPGQSHE